MTPRTKRRFFEKYASAVAYLATEDAHGQAAIGSAFHVGDGVFVTARHVVADRKITAVAAPQSSTERVRKSGVPLQIRILHAGGTGKIVGGPFFHPNEQVDVAAVRVEGIDAATLPLGAHLDDWLGTELVLTAVLLLGFPRVPFAMDPPLLVSASGEVNAVVDLYNAPGARFIVSPMARGGFSGGPAISEYGVVLGVVTDSLVENHAQPETGYCSVISVEAILDCLRAHDIMSAAVKKFWQEHGLFLPDAAEDSGTP